MGDSEDRTDAELLAGYLAGREEPFEALVRRHAPMVLGVCRRLLGPGPDAEDAGQATFAVLAAKARRLAGERDLAAWLHRAAVLVSRTALRGRSRRLRHEKEAGEMRRGTEVSPEHAAAWRELAGRLDQELDALPARDRQALVLCYFEGLSRSEAARRLALPETTLASRSARALEKLRARLSAGGEASPAVATLGPLIVAMARVEAPGSFAAAALAAAKGAATGTAVGVLAKGAMQAMLWMKIKLAAAVLGSVVLLGGGAVTVTALAAAGPEKPAEPAPKTEPPAPGKFATPITSPNAEWEFEGLWSGGGYQSSNHGMVDGPRRGVRSATTPGPGIFSEDGGENVFRKYDEQRDRFFTVAGCGAPGEVNVTGSVPLSRVRLGGWGYSSGAMMAGNSKYGYIRLNAGGKANVKKIDYEKRVMDQFLEVSPGTALCGYEGGLLLIGGGVAKKYSDDGKLLAEMKLEKTGGEAMQYDPKHNRLYGMTREGSFGANTDHKGWLIWYWDLEAGGKMVGLIAGQNHPDNQPLRAGMATGPFKGSRFWCPGGIWWGPDDPDYRYLYMGGGDEGSFYRLDFEKQYWVKLKPKGVDKWNNDGRNPDGKRYQFGESSGLMQINARGGSWTSSGDFFTGYRNECFRWKRVQ